MPSLWQDFRFALRTLARSPVFTAVAVLSLALGIGANTAIFSLLDQLLLRMLPVRDPAEFAVLRSVLAYPVVVQPLLGRPFSRDEDRRGRNSVALVSQGFWKRRFGGAPDVAGRTLTLDDRSYAIVGVMPDSFRFRAASRA